MLTQYDCNMYPILAPKFLNKGEGGGGHEFTAWSNTSYVKFITPFNIHTQILNLMFKCKNYYSYCPLILKLDKNEKRDIFKRYVSFNG